LIFNYVLATRHCDLDQYDSVLVNENSVQNSIVIERYFQIRKINGKTYLNFRMLFQEQFKSSELMRYALDIVQSIDSNEYSAAFEFFFQFLDLHKS
jgi:hypothetical protein